MKTAEFDDLHLELSNMLIALAGREKDVRWKRHLMREATRIMNARVMEHVYVGIRNVSVLARRAV